MKQRQTTRNWSKSEGGGRPTVRVLIESADPALAVSDFGVYAAAGVEVALCQGPDHDSTDCPLVRGEPCHLVAGADVVLSDLGPSGPDVVEAQRRSYPATPVVLWGSWNGEVPEGCVSLPATASVEGQIAVLRHEARIARTVRAAGRATGA